MMCARLLFAVFVGRSVADTFDPSQESLVLLQTQAVKIIEGNKQDFTYGHSKCQCVAIQGITGTVAVSINGGRSTDTSIGHLYPAELGSFCNAWDEGKYPGSCDGNSTEKWCAEQWCYVDPCDCELSTNPSSSYYLDGATYQGKQIFYSYVTCGATNYFNDPPLEAITTECAKDWSETFGLEECPCVGISNLKGTTDVVIKNSTIKGLYPADLGSACIPWDENLFPGSCDGKSPEAFCGQEWCYVDKNNCKVPKGPFASYYLKDGQFRGEPLYYSYLTCGGDNNFDAGEVEATSTKSSATTVGLGSVALAVVMLHGSI